MVQPLERDPEGVETAQVRRLSSLAGAKVIEIGAGDGRLSWRYGDLAHSVVGVDLSHPVLVEAAAAASRYPDIRFSPVQSAAEMLPLPTGWFDVGLLAWSL